MNIFKREKTGPYWFRFMYKGKLIRKSSGVYKKEDAKDIGAAYRTKLVKGELDIADPEPVPVPRFKQAMADFLEWAEVEYASHPNTYKRYQTSSKPLVKYFEDRVIDTIKQ